MTQYMKYNRHDIYLRREGHLRALEYISIYMRIYISMTQYITYNRHAVYLRREGHWRALEYISISMRIYIYDSIHEI